MVLDLIVLIPESSFKTGAAEYAQTACMADPHQRTSANEGRGFNSTHSSSFSAAWGIVVVCLQLFMEKQEWSAFCPDFSVLLTVQCGRGMFAISIQF